MQNTATITVESEQQYQVVSSFIDAHDEVTYGGVKYTHTNEEKYKLDVVELACRKLIEKKAAYEKGLGVELTLLRFAEGPQPAGGPHPHTRLSYSRDLAFRLSSTPEM